MHFDLIAQCLFLLTVANGAPILASRILGDTLSWPVDGGAALPDGHRLLGPTMTFRGVVAALAATSLLAPVIGVSWAIGLSIAAMSIAGDLLSSFAKRRMAMAPSSRCTGLDQIPEALIPALGAMPLLVLSVYDVALVVVLFFAGAIVLSRLLFRLKIRRRPY